MKLTFSPAQMFIGMTIKSFNKENYPRNILKRKKRYKLELHWARISHRILSRHPITRVK